MATADKYDRQLRLWGSNGQRLLMNSHILLINSVSVGTETLKNLVLPGLGSFTILDNQKISYNDITNNFFTSITRINQQDQQEEEEEEDHESNNNNNNLRGQIAMEYLTEMNPDVKGYYLNSTLEIELEIDPLFLKKFSLVIVANPIPSISKLVSNSCWELSVPLIIVRSYGFIGSYRFQVHGIHGIIESKTEADLPDLRINAPFPDLVEYCNKFDLSNQDSVQHSHTPYVVILYYALVNWKQNHDGKVPKTVAEKKEFKALIESWRDQTKNSEELNYTEAIANAHRAFAPLSPPDNIQEIFNAPFMLEPLHKDSSSFKILLHSLKLFIESHGNGFLPPLKGSIPDMTSTSENFVNLQQVYLKKALEDKVFFTHLVSETLTSLGKSTNFISESEIDSFCKNISNIRYVETSSILQSETLPNQEVIQEILNDPYLDPIQTPFLYYVGLKAVDEFYTLYNRYPGEIPKLSLLSNDINDTNESQEEWKLGSEKDLKLVNDDSEILWNILQALAIRYGIQISTKLENKDDNEEDNNKSNNSQENIDNIDNSETIAKLTQSHARELTRYGGVELHNISSLMGGIAAQEAVKIITHLYVPLSNTYVFNGIAGCGGNYNL
mmetsp:Transcript_14646/g.15344  ORF Transcript_14646/g.15344 Transcript_14646/m.15344 type:complete len:613 (-) Transcript_14646:64-1902(-)